MTKPYRFPDHQVAGDADTTVFLLHGAYGSKDYFRHEIETLVKAGLRVVAWDAPGYGISPLPPDGLSIERMAETAGCLIDRVGSRTNIVLGHSMGGVMAPAVCAARPDKVHAVVISATVASFSQKSEEDKKNFLAERIEPLRQGKSFRDTAGAVIDSMFAPGSQGPMVELVREVALSTSSETFCAAIQAIVDYDGMANLKALKVPLLLLAGAHDKVGRPEGMKNIQSSFVPHADYACLPASGHYAFAEEHALFNQHLLDFIRGRVTARA
ncbi:alpha/beta fold hydrolase [Ottowia testudinis]|uniref:Alpha/beta fold hydrolase n=1 Tax=Ottowia testudinis TaxID=2816950 RepID=A0A975H455_9BURK|nr:alpha/beta hydrolase [Ottowia testudinis]QTD46548.1 alpha/beta fold hydrolase [Ottowia testudinis]